MPEAETSNVFYIWGIDDAPYGPVELPALISWIKDERVLADTWVFARAEGAWRQAGEVRELQMFFRKKPAPGSDAGVQRGVAPGTLRRVKILADLNDAQLDTLSQFIEPMRVAQWAAVVKQGDHGDAMFLVMEGELRARVKVGEKETILATFGPGEFFGEMSLFDHGARSADVIANVDSTVLKLTSASFERLAKEAPALATPFLQATARTLSARIRADNQRLNRVSQQLSATGN